MIRQIILLAVGAMVVVGCGAHSPVTVEPTPMPTLAQAIAPDNGPHRLWGEWTWYIPASRDRVDVVPKRLGRFHLNGLKFLEEYCTDCLKITAIKNNGDGTLDVTVKIKHPFPGHPEYTGFDVKGIIMFQGSHVVDYSSKYIYPYDDFRLSWKEKGDPELLNPDGYSPRWSPWWDSGSSMPIFNYWPGKYSNGQPSANINAYINFYTDETRHIFLVNGEVERTYHIWLPPGPQVMGYAVEACWEPPTKTPVIDPVADFPESANQEEPYFLQMVVNNNQPITDPNCCGSFDNCDTLWVERRQWWGETADRMFIIPDNLMSYGGWLNVCPDNPDLLSPGAGYNLSDHGAVPDGAHRGMLIAYFGTIQGGGWIYRSFAYTVFDYVIDLQ
jgi:hypothetical protein